MAVPTYERAGAHIPCQLGSRIASHIPPEFVATIGGVHDDDYLFIRVSRANAEAHCMRNETLLLLNWRMMLKKVQFDSIHIHVLVL